MAKNGESDVADEDQIMEDGEIKSVRTNNFQEMEDHDINPIDIGVHYGASEQHADANSINDDGGEKIHHEPDNNFLQMMLSSAG